MWSSNFEALPGCSTGAARLNDGRARFGRQIRPLLGSPMRLSLRRTFSASLARRSALQGAGCV